jgi:transposase
MLDNDKCESITNILSSQRISDLFMLIKQDDIINFYSTWKDKNDQNEFFALDITSVSSYSNLIQSVEYGYNRDRDNLRQINLCMLLGEKSWLPKFSFIYNGSLSDVSTLITTIEQLNGINFQQINLVLDKGFFSTKNIDFLLGNQNEPKFVIAVPFSNKFALDAVNKSANDNKNIDNVIQIGNDTVFSSSREFNWDKHKKIFVYTFYNPIIYENKRISLINDIYAMIDDVKNDPEKYKNIENYKKHLIIRRSKLYECGYSIKINKEVYEKELINKGWLVIISNTGYSASEIINIYRNKDVVEKGFDNLKNNLQLHRLNVHSEKTMESKIFVSLISLIIMLYINKIMSKNKLYKNYTLHSLLSTLDLIKAQVYNNKLIIMPVSKKQRDIYKFFNCPLPSNITF